MARDPAERIRTLRLLMGLTQGELAEAAGVSQPLISQMQKGTRAVTDDVLQRIAAATGTPLSFFYVDPTDLPTDTLLFRKKASTSVKEVNRVEATVREAYRVAARLLTETRVRRATLPRAEGDLSVDDIEDLAAETRDALGIARDGVIGHVIRACERAGIPVVPLVLVDGEGHGEDIVVGHSGVSCWRGPAEPSLISYFSAGSGDRQRFTTGHELGHLVLHPARRANLTPKEAESEAHRFAGAFLMPRDRAREAFDGPLMLRDLAELKKRWGISIQALINRACDVGRIDHDRKESLYKQLSARGWRTNEPVTVHPEQPALMRAMLARRYGEPPSLLQSSEDLGLHPVLMRSLAPDVAGNPAPKRTDNVISLGDRIQKRPSLQAL
ncbi:ImmA/IrrE family metallo-endopeptidase [Streptomyces sp. F001]|uniref:helix-turn-helix domain-containing protein n=1 Tax=Streptomyces sp. F001 TaxID=1510026 RepID=UPI00101E37F4|nr:XRE family transcriptional regulator [Streptomyces sp. F001]RZB18383.1 ImmA/IrrE family metallo-endopeptidase [Streptomyces sp. F001]